MTALEGSSALAAIVGLIFNWMQVRDAAAEDQYQAFLLWLDNHHFQELRSKIAANGDLQRELNLLLREDTQSLSAKLDVLYSGVSALACRIEHLANVAQSLNAPKEALSDQAVELLQKFTESNTAYLFLRCADPRASFHVVFQPSNRMWKCSEPRFLESEIKSLEGFKYLQYSATEEAYTLTRFGAAFAQQSKAVTGHMTEYRPSLDQYRNMVVAG